MRVFTNGRAWRVMFLLWVFAGALAWALFGVVYGLLTGNEGSLWVGAILAPIIAVFLGGMEFYARRYATAIDATDDQVTIHTRSLSGRRSHSGTADVGPLRHLASPNFMFDDSGIGPDTQHFSIKLMPANKTYIVDITGDAAMREHIASALAKA